MTHMPFLGISIRQFYPIFPGVPGRRSPARGKAKPEIASMTSETTLEPGFTRGARWAPRWGPLLLALLIGVWLGSEAGNLASAAVRLAAPAREPAPAGPEWRVRELPSEWRWEGREYRFDRMFRRPRPAARS
jgi:hypothetical protein